MPLGTLSFPNHRFHDAAIFEPTFIGSTNGQQQQKKVKQKESKRREQGQDTEIGNLERLPVCKHPILHPLQYKGPELLKALVRQ